MHDPVLVSSADGVGTKLRLAFMTGVHTTIGRDLVNHCVNDILVQGAEPLFFLDYLATGKLDPDVAVQIVEGLAAACRENGCALLGGETAEMPGFYADGEYDVAGFIVGAVERERLIDGRAITAGDVLIGLPSSGLHTNGYSLARRIVFDVAGLKHDCLRSGARPDGWRGADGAAPLVPAGDPAAAGARHRSRGWRISPAAASPITCRGSCPTALHAEIDRDAWRCRRCFGGCNRSGESADRRHAAHLQHGHRA